MLSKPPWYDRKFTVIILIIIIFPVGLYGLWKSKVFSQKGKIAWTIGILAMVIIGNINQQPPPPSIKEAAQKENNVKPISPTEKHQLPEANNTLTSEAINVNIEISHKIESGKLYISGKTNLPNKTQLMISLSRGNSYHAQSKVTVQGDNFFTEGFSHKGQPLRNGDYTIYVSTPISKRQPDSVKKQIGEHGEHLKGQLITRDSDIFKEDNFVKFKTDFIITESISMEVQDDSPLLLSHLEKFETHYAKLQTVMQTGILTGSWSGQWNRKLNILRKSFDKKFGKTSRDYYGECPQAFFNIAVGAGYMFNVWSEYNALNSGRGKSQVLQDMKGYVAEHFGKARKEINSCSK